MFRYTTNILYLPAVFQWLTISTVQIYAVVTTISYTSRIDRSSVLVARLYHGLMGVVYVNTSSLLYYDQAAAVARGCDLTCGVLWL